MERYFSAFNEVNNRKLKEECGVIGIFNPDDNESSDLLFYGLYALQHRGQDSAGIASSDGVHNCHYKKAGLVSEVFDEEILEQLKGHISIGHVRYGSVGGKKVENAQPLVVNTKNGTIYMGHNGNIINADKIRKDLEKEGIKFKTDIDSEVIINLIYKFMNEDNDIIRSIEKMMDTVQGAYALVIMTEDEVIGVRDPHALRPLCLGELDNGWVLASESCALDAMGAEFIRDLQPGEIIRMNKDGLDSICNKGNNTRASCIFEYVYFARPDSVIDGANVYKARQEAGRLLAKEHPMEADMVIAVPDSSIPIAIGYAKELDIPFGEGLFKNPYVGRTFIEPTKISRERTLRLKLAPLARNIKGKKVVVIDDSIVRGTTSKRIVSSLRKAGATEIHLRISSPPIGHSCYYGIDTPNRDELLGATKSIEEIRELVGADSLGFLSLESLIKSTGLPKETFCTACFSGDYPISISDI